MKMDGRIPSGRKSRIFSRNERPSERDNPTEIRVMIGWPAGGQTQK